MQSTIHNVSEYAEELWRCIGDVSEKHGVRYTGSYSDTTPSSITTWCMCQSTTLHIKLHAFPMHLQCISKALLCTLMHCISDSACYTTLHCPLHLHLCHAAPTCLFVCLFPLPDCFC